MLTKIQFTCGTLDRLHSALTGAPEMQPVNPPEPDPETEDRNLRNSCREDILRAITLIEDRLEELGEITRERCLNLTALRNEIAADFEG